MIVDIKEIEINGITYKRITNADLRNAKFLNKLFDMYYDAILAYPAIPNNCINGLWRSPSPEKFQENEIGIYIQKTKTDDEYIREYE
jgi:predicted aconitase